MEFFPVNMTGTTGHVNATATNLAFFITNFWRHYFLWHYIVKNYIFAKGSF